MKVLHEINPTRFEIREAQRSGLTTGLVPTMGALHEGHLSLIREAKKRCEWVAVTLFVNPTQFIPGEDFQQYPRTLEADLEACEKEGVELVFAPTLETMHVEGASTTVRVEGVPQGLCGSHRPGHFEGVATIVAKLFNILPADYAFFGEKDYQQLVMIQKMVHDLDIPIQIVPCPIVREADGLAMSSRNRYLNAQQRLQAVGLSRSLFGAVKMIRSGHRDAPQLCQSVREVILATGPVDIEYVEVVDAKTLKPLTVIDRPARMCLAVKFGTCRLIDNVELIP